jgi:hypothetical protein
METDKRRSQYVPMETRIAFGDFGTKLIDKWGMEGIAGWLLLLAACKRESVQGQFIYTSDFEGWSKLGATASGYTLDEFFTYTGRLKKTSRTRHGRTQYVTVTRWEEWNTPPANRQNPRKQPQITEHLPENTSEKEPVTRLEVEAEVEVEIEKGRAEEPAHLEQEIVKLLKLEGCDGRSAATVAMYARQLPIGVVADIRTRAYETGKGIRWAVSALKDEAKERAA